MDCSRTWWLALLVACAPRVELGEVEIVGGTEEARAIVREELVAFDEWIGPGRLRLTKVVFEDLRDPSLDGRAWRVWDRIDLDDDLGHDRIRPALRHELCHALDYAESLLASDVAAFDRFGEMLFDHETGPLDGRENARRRRSEALAIVCESGPLGALGLASRCPGEPSLVADLTSWTTEHVWMAYDAAPLALSETIVSKESEWGAWETFDLDPTDDPERLWLQVYVAEADDVHERSGQIETYTGDWVSTDLAAQIPESADPPPGLPADDAALVFGPLGWPDGPGAAVVEFGVTGLLDPAFRLVAVERDGSWAPVDVCVASDMDAWSLFTADERVWFAWGDGVTMSWAPVGE